jgi:hypothetical protein
VDLNAAFDLHFAYAAMVILGIGLVLAFPVTKHFEDPRDKRRYYAMQIITAVCAVIGAKLAVVLGDALWPLREFHGWDLAARVRAGRSRARCCSAFSVPKRPSPCCATTFRRTTALPSSCPSRSG